VSVTTLLNSLLAYDPATIDPALRAQVSGVLKARSELLTVQGELASLRARTWAGSDESLNELIELKSAVLKKLRKDHTEKQLEVLKGSVDVEGLLEILPDLGVALLEKLNLPVPVLLEVFGADFDALKEMLAAGRELINEL